MFSYSLERMPTKCKISYTSFTLEWMSKRKAKEISYIFLKKKQHFLYLGTDAGKRKNKKILIAWDDF